MLLDEILTARLCCHCSDPLEDQPPDAGGIVVSQLEPGFAHFLCEWEALLALKGAA